MSLIVFTKGKNVFVSPDEKTELDYGNKEERERKTLEEIIDEERRMWKKNE